MSLVDAHDARFTELCRCFASHDVRLVDDQGVLRFSCASFHLSAYCQTSSLIFVRFVCLRMHFTYTCCFSLSFFGRQLRIPGANKHAFVRALEAAVVSSESASEQFLAQLEQHIDSSSDAFLALLRPVAFKYVLFSADKRTLSHARTRTRAGLPARRARKALLACCCRSRRCSRASCSCCSSDCRRTSATRTSSSATSSATCRACC